MRPPVQCFQRVENLAPRETDFPTGFSAMPERRGAGTTSLHRVDRRAALGDGASAFDVGRARGLQTHRVAGLAGTGAAGNHHVQPRLHAAAPYPHHGFVAPGGAPIARPALGEEDVDPHPSPARPTPSTRPHGRPRRWPARPGCSRLRGPIPRGHRRGGRQSPARRGSDRRNPRPSI